MPSVFPAAYKQVKRREDQREQRYRRLQERRLGLALQESVKTQKQMELQTEQDEEGQGEEETAVQAEEEGQEEDPVQQADSIETREQETTEVFLSQPEVAVTREQGMQTKDDLMNRVQTLEKENAELRKRLDTETFSIRVIEGNDHRTKFYTGLPAWVIFLHLFMFLSPFFSQPRALSLMDEFFLVLMRLRLNLMVEDLAYRFRVSY